MIICFKREPLDNAGLLYLSVHHQHLIGYQANFIFPSSSLFTWTSFSQTFNKTKSSIVEHIIDSSNSSRTINNIIIINSTTTSSPITHNSDLENKGPKRWFYELWDQNVNWKLIKGLKDQLSLFSIMNCCF